MTKKKKNIYERYVDDILLLADNIEEIKKLHSKNSSVLKFTYELNIKNEIPFLDVLIDAKNYNFNTSVYKKTY